MLRARTSTGPRQKRTTIALAAVLGTVSWSGVAIATNPNCHYPHTWAIAVDPTTKPSWTYTCPFTGVGTGADSGSEPCGSGMTLVVCPGDTVQWSGSTGGYHVTASVQKRGHRQPLFKDGGGNPKWKYDDDHTAPTTASDATVFARSDTTTYKYTLILRDLSTGQKYRDDPGMRNGGQGVSLAAVQQSLDVFQEAPDRTIQAVCQGDLKVCQDALNKLKKAVESQSPHK